MIQSVMISWYVDWSWAYLRANMIHKLYDVVREPRIDLGEFSPRYWGANMLVPPMARPAIKRPA